MQRYSAIVDASTLIYYTRLKKDYNILPKLRLVFSRLLIPTEIKSEFERGATKDPNRDEIIQQIRIHGSFLTLCTSFDLVAKVLLETTKGIDKGEAEAVAQNKQVKARFILSDDKKFTKAIRSLDKYVTVISTLHIIAMLDLHMFEMEVHYLVRHFHKIQKFKSRDLRQAYVEVCNWYGISIPKKQLSRKCSLSKILN